MDITARKQHIDCEMRRVQLEMKKVQKELSCFYNTGRIPWLSEDVSLYDGVKYKPRNSTGPVVLGPVRVEPKMLYESYVPLCTVSPIQYASIDNAIYSHHVDSVFLVDNGFAESASCQINKIGRASCRERV